MVWNIMGTIFLAFVGLLSVAHRAEAAPATLTYQGRILKADGSPLTNSNVSFIFQILNPSGTCVIYQEQVNGYDMTSTGGVFDVPIGLGTVTHPSTGSFLVLDAFNNSDSFECRGGTSTYHPIATDNRILRVQFHDGEGWRTISPDNVIRSVPYAGYAYSTQKLGTYLPQDFVTKAGIPSCGANEVLNFDSPTGAFNCAPISISATQVAGNISGTASGFTGSLVGDVTGTQSATRVTALHNRPVASVAPAANQVLQWNGTNWAPADLPTIPGGTVTSLSATAPLSVTNASSTPVVSINKATGTASGYLDSVDFNIFAGKQNPATSLAGYGITDGVRNNGGVISMHAGLDSGKSALTTAGQIYLATDTQRLYRHNGSAVELIASASSGGTLTTVTSANADITVVNSGTSAALTLNAGTGNNQILKLDGSARIPAVNGSLITNLDPLKLSSVVPVTMGGTGQSTFTNGQILIGNSTGNTLSKSTLTPGTGISIVNGAGSITISATGAPPTGTASGDLSGSYPNPTVAKINGAPLTFSTLTSGQFLKHNGSAWINSGITTADVSGITAYAPLTALSPTASCTAAQTVYWNSVTSALACKNIAISGSQVSLNASHVTTALGYTPVNASASVTTSANSLVQRNPSGYIYNNYFNMTADVRTVTPQYLVGSWGGDNFLRYVAPTNVTVGNATNAVNATNATNATNSTYATYINNDAYNMKLHWSGQAGQPTWLWGSNNGTDSYVYNPSNFSVNYANSAGVANSVAAANISGNFGTINATGGIRPGASTAVTACGMGQANGEGTMRYNYIAHAMQYCNGTEWVSIGATPPAPPQIAIITATGTWMKPPGVTKVRIQAVGGGGSGDNYGGGYKGAPGTYVDTGEQTYPTAAETFTITVGAAGYDADCQWSVGGAGGVTTVAKASHGTVTAAGGAGSSPAHGYAVDMQFVETSFPHGSFGRGGGGYTSANTCHSFGATGGAVVITYQ